MDLISAQDSHEGCQNNTREMSSDHCPPNLLIAQPFQNESSTPADFVPSIQVTTPGGGVQTPPSPPSFTPPEEEYFEEFHLPNTHENAFVRHLSFRRRVQKTPINAPEADRIEGLVRAGEFVRHGSIRKRIVPEEKVDEEEEDWVEEQELEGKNSTFSKRIQKDIREIERYLSEEDASSEQYSGINDNSSLRDSSSAPDITPNTPPKSLLTQKTSTPRPYKAGCEVNNTGYDLERDFSLSPGEDGAITNFSSEYSNAEDMSIEESTVRKIKECLDFTSYKDMLNLTGKLSDLLSPKEVESVLLNSERYRQYLDSEVIEALSLSYQGSSHSLPYNINMSDQSFKQTNKSKFKDDSHHSLSANAHSDIDLSASQNDPPASTGNADSGFSSPQFPKEEKSNDEDACVHGDVEPGNKKKIAAPAFNCDSSTDTKPEEVVEEYSGPSRKRISVCEGITDGIDRSINVSDAWEADESVGAKFPYVSEVTEVCENEDVEDGENRDVECAPHPPPDVIPAATAALNDDLRHWRNVVIGGSWRRIDMKAIAPFRKCISHGGFMELQQTPIVVISAPLLPEKGRSDYDYVMDNLFMYVLSFLEQLVSDDYVLVYFSGGTRHRFGPGFSWMHRAYDMIDRRLRKNLASLLVVHPSMWARTIIALSRPFISSKFYRKVSFVPNLTCLAQLVPLEQLQIPDEVKQADFEIMIKEKLKTRS